MSDINIPPIRNKVVCINENGWDYKKNYLWNLFTRTVDCKGPKKGDIVTVTKELYEEGIKYYVLLEWSEDDNDGWIADCFVPIQENFATITYEKVMEKESPLISVN